MRPAGDERSLYLVHGPLVLMAGAALLRFQVGAMGSALACALLIPLVIGIAYAFYRIAERPFLSAEFRAAIEGSDGIAGARGDEEPEARCRQSPGPASGGI